MPFDSQGNFSRVHNWEQDRINGIKIVSDRHDQEDDNFADGFDLCFIRDGRAAMTGNLNAGGFQVKNMIAGSSSTDAVNKSQLDALQTTVQAYADAIIPKGTIFPYGGTTAPAGFLMCDGSAVSRTTYAALFAVIGTAYGTGNGSTTFNLPDYRDRTVFMRSDKAVGQTSLGSIPDHRHTITAQNADTGWSGGTFLTPSGTTNTSYASADTSLFGSSLYSKTVNKVIPSHASCNFIIKY